MDVASKTWISILSDIPAHSTNLEQRDIAKEDDEVMKTELLNTESESRVDDQTSPSHEQLQGNTDTGDTDCDMKNSFTEKNDKLTKLQVESAATSQVHVCSFCGEIFKREFNMKQHEQIHDLTCEQYKCDICYRVLAVGEKLVDHVSHNHQQGEVSCACKEAFGDLMHLRVHKQTCFDHYKLMKKRVTYKCVQCEISYLRKDSYNLHSKTKHQASNNESKMTLRKPEKRKLTELGRNMLERLSSHKKKLCVDMSKFTRPSKSRGRHGTGEVTGDDHSLRNITTTAKSTGENVVNLRTLCEEMDQQGKDVLVLIAEKDSCQWYGSQLAKKFGLEEGNLVYKFFKHCQDMRAQINKDADSKDNIKKTSPKTLEREKTKKNSCSKRKNIKVKFTKVKKSSKTKIKRYGKNSNKYCNTLVEDEDNIETVIDPSESQILESKIVLSESRAETGTANEVEVTDSLVAAETEPACEDADVAEPISDVDAKTTQSETLTCVKCRSSFQEESQLESHQRHYPNCVEKFSCKMSDKDVLKESHTYVDPDIGVEVTATFQSLLDSQTKAPFQCVICKCVFEKQRKLFRHLTMHNLSAIFDCHICPRNFRTVDALDSHLRRHKTKPFICQYCTKIFNTYLNLEHHKTYGCSVFYKVDEDKTSTSPTNLSCPNCNFEGENMVALLAHVGTHKDGIKYVCMLCDKQFLTKEALKQHALSSHKTDRPFICQCGKSFKEKSAFNRHFKIHGERKFKCNVCEKTFHDSSNLTSHKKTHLGLKPYVCDYCGAAYRKKIYFDNHRRIHTGDRPYKCDFEGCGKTFRGSQSLLQHKRTHSAVGAFICDICGRTFKQPGHLNHHRKSHSIEWRWPCNYCDEKFKSCWTFKRHLAQNHGDKKEEIERTTNFRLHECPTCKKMYHDLEDLRRHINNHEGIKPFKCQYCSKAFSDKSNLSAHQFIHTGRKKLKCNTCYKTFIHQVNLNAHMEKVHKKSSSEAEHQNDNLGLDEKIQFVSYTREEPQMAYTLNLTVSDLAVI